MTKRIVLINAGPLKLEVVGRAFSSLFPEAEFDIQAFEYDDKKSHITPFNECLEYMRLVVSDAKNNIPDAGYYIFMRGRFDDLVERMNESALVLIQDSFGNEGYSQAASFEVPESIAQQLREGISFSTAVEKVYNAKGVKEGSGFVGILTKSVVSKAEQYFQPVVIALSTCVRKQVL